MIAVIRKFRTGMFRYHLAAWTVYCVIIFLLDVINLGEKFNIVRELVVIALEVWIFYSFLGALKLAAFMKRYTALSAGLFLALSFLVTLYGNYLRAQVAARYGYTLFNHPKEWITDTVIWYIHFSVYALGYYYFRRSIRNMKEIKDLAFRKLLVEKEKLELANANVRLQQELLQSENNFLRAQINPHFLYNCLNLFYSETFREQPRVAEAIMMLSQIMRYSITDFSASGGMALLEDEVEHIQRVIMLNRFRFSDALQVEFEVKGDVRDKKIVPMVLITLVENIFKHGDLQDATQPATITCTVEAEQQRVYFVTGNRTDQTRTTYSSGLGIANIRQRLKLLYPDDFYLLIEDTEEYFRTELSVPYFNMQ